MQAQGARCWWAGDRHWECGGRGVAGETGSSGDMHRNNGGKEQEGKGQGSGPLQFTAAFPATAVGAQS